MKIRIFPPYLSFTKEPMWKIRINDQDPEWMVRRSTPHEAVAQAASMQWGDGVYHVTPTHGGRFAIEVKHKGPAKFRALGVASCTPA